MVICKESVLFFRISDHCPTKVPWVLLYLLKWPAVEAEDVVQMAFSHTLGQSKYFDFELLLDFLFVSIVTPRAGTGLFSLTAPNRSWAARSALSSMMTPISVLWRKASTWRASLRWTWTWGLRIILLTNCECVGRRQSPSWWFLRTFHGSSATGRPASSPLTRWAWSDPCTVFTFLARSTTFPPTADGNFTPLF